MRPRRLVRFFNAPVENFLRINRLTRATERSGCGNHLLVPRLGVESGPFATPGTENARSAPICNAFPQMGDDFSPDSHRMLFIHAVSKTMSHGRAGEQSSRAASETRLGAARLVERVTRQAALERVRPGRSIRRDQKPALPDAILCCGGPSSRAAIEQSEIERFRTVLGGRGCAEDPRRD